MSGVLTWFIEMIVCAGILFANYYALLRNNRFHSYNRYYLLAAVLLSVLIPLVRIPLDFSASQVKPAAIWRTLTAISWVTANKPERPAENISTVLTLKDILILVYVLIASAIFTRFVTAIIFIRKLLLRYKAERTANIYFVSTAEPSTPFSFFKWLFWNNKIELQSDNGQKIFRHELFHIQQRHSWDLAFLELTTAIFWINPFFHLIKKEVKTIHEFLADEFATNENDKWSYAELLLMQLLGSSNRLVNPFFHNQIKRRIAMITTSKTPKYQFFRKLMILPITVIILALFAFKVRLYTEFKFEKPKPVIATTNVDLEPKLLASTDFSQVLDTTKPKAKQEVKGNGQKEIHQKNIEDDNDAMESKKLMEEKQREIQKAQQEFQLLMMERQKETHKAQEEFREELETRQQQGQQEAQERFRQFMEERQKEAEKYQEEFKKMMAMKQQDAEKSQEEFRKMMEARQREAEQGGQEKFKQLIEEKQKESEKFGKEFNRLMMMKQREAEKSQEEFRKLLEQRQQEMQKMQEEFQKRMSEKNRKQVI